MTITPKVGTVVTSSCTFTASTGGVGDPGVVTCKVKNPLDVVVVETYNPGDIVKDSVGVYHLDVLVTDPGAWTLEWIGSVSGPVVVQCAMFFADDACI